MKLQEINLDQVSTVYVGLDNHCRCGCGGTYANTSYMEGAGDEVDDKLALRRLNKAKKLALQPDTEVEYNDTFINVSYGNNRAITIYLDDLKK